jgi:hypothetical protein
MLTYKEAPRMTNERSSFLAKRKRIEAKVDRALQAGPNQLQLIYPDNSAANE